MRVSKKKMLILSGLEAIIVATIYGLFSYFIVFRILAGEVMLYAYLWHIGIILVILLSEKLFEDSLMSDDFWKKLPTEELAKSATKKEFNRFGWVSFKTELYLFYLFVLVLSRVSILDPTLIDENFMRFVFSIEYCLILLVVFDKLLEQFFKDDKKRTMIVAKIIAAIKQKRKSTKRRKFKK